MIKYRNNIKNFIASYFIINDSHYKLYALICIPNHNHYTSFWNICLNDELNIALNESYYYNDLLENGEIELIKGLNFETKLNQKIEFNPYIIIYIKDS